MVTIKTMAAMQAVLDTGSFRGASQQLSLAQSVVSAHVMNFEQWFDYPIFEPGRRAAIPTLEGEAVLRCAREVLHRHSELLAFAWGADNRFSSTQAFDARSITLKQIETFYWLMKLESVVRAGNKLNITQAAASRRLQELTARCVGLVFSTPRQKTELTEFGWRVLELCEAVLTAFADLKARRSNANTPETVLHIGMTELVALTWFPNFVQRFKEAYPHIVLHPDVDISTSLQEKLMSGTMDIVIIPQPSLTDAMDRVEVGSTLFSWFCAPGTFGKRKRISLFALASKPLLIQGKESGLTMITQRLFASAGLAPRQIFGSNSLVALAGLIESGIGVSCLPRSLFRDLVKQNRLQVIESTTPPKATYFVAFLKQHQSGLYYAAAEIAKQTCRF
ncbi:LysR family transcriptional regulator [Candidimonas sp. SYP-B2681]|uniref:LysR substrate-binding domain-containing protein n=1 Tax=Candidimonas sp. SYP-B2681 TaxID=2497686 RepID=UPI000F8696EA|nr:LysR substrate-binding domain-containing protein [Candidimonas sp. SYP-B2681]RTZ41500.1 LysR family transcriptional regulator [Candidimonas sp. SYP-B2681]